MYIVFKVLIDFKNDINIDSISPGSRIKISTDKKFVLFNYEKNNALKKYQIEKSEDIDSDKEYYVEMVSAQLCQNELTINEEPEYDYNRLTIKFHLTTNEVKIKCKIYGEDKYKKRIACKYLIENEQYSYLYKDAMNNTSKIRNLYSCNKEALSSEEKQGREKYVYDEYMNKYSNCEDKFTDSVGIIEFNMFDNSDLYFKIEKDSIDLISSNLLNLIDLKKCLNYLNNDLTNYKNNLSNFKYIEELTKLISIAENEISYCRIYNKKGHTGNCRLDRLLSHLTYINLHSLNGLIFADCKEIEKIQILGLEKKHKRGHSIEKDDKDNNIDEGTKIVNTKEVVSSVLGTYYYIENKDELNEFKKIFNINDDLSIGKYIIIGPDNIEKFVDEFLSVYRLNYYLATKKDNNDNILTCFSEFAKKVICKITKLVFLHEVGHMAFSNASVKNKIKSNESAANWFASLNLNGVEKYIVYLMTLLQPVVYQDYFTDGNLLPGGQLFQFVTNPNELNDAVQKYDIKTNTSYDDMVDYRNKLNEKYYIKVKDMIDDMYL